MSMPLTNADDSRHHASPSLASAETDALVVGDDLATWQAVSAVWPTLGKPRFWCNGQHQRPVLPAYREGTLVLQNVHELSMSDQQELLEWCRKDHSRAKLVATASPSLASLVEGGTFDRRLHDYLGAAQLLFV